MEDALIGGFAASRHLFFHRGGRKENCTIPAIDEFPAGFFTKEQRLHGAVVIHLIVAVYILVILGIICNEYFVPAIEKFVSYCHIESDVTGASIMAAAGSAPQLATSLIGVFIAKSDIGVGSVVGASFFNIFFIIGLCPFFIKEPIKLAWWPLVRDSFFYSLAAASLAFLATDQRIQVYDSAIMVGLYVIYLIVLVFNARLEHLFSTCIRTVRMGFARCRCKNCRGSNLRGTCISCNLDTSETVQLHPQDSQSVSQDDPDEEKPSASSYNSFSEPVSSPDEVHRNSQNGTARDGGDKESLATDQDAEGQRDQGLSVDTEYRSILHLPEKHWKKVVWAILLPALFVVYIIVPDCRRPGAYRYIFILTMLLSVVVIGLSSYVLVWMVAIVGSTIGIPDTVMGLTFLAAGSSIPDIFNAVIVTRHGYGDMAVSNSIGSNIFDILISLGLPWLIHILVSDGLKPVIIYDDVSTVSISLLATALIVVVCLFMNKFKLNKCMGGMFMGAYISFVVFIIIFDTSTSLPDCESVL